MLKLIMDIAGGLVGMALIVIGVTFRATGKLTPRPPGKLSFRDAAKILWPAYIANLRFVLRNTWFWGVMGAATAFWIVATVQGWLPQR